MKKYLLIFIISLFLTSNIVIAYEDYKVSDSDFSSGYTKDLAPGDKFTISIDGGGYFIQVLSIYQNLVDISVSKNDKKSFAINDNYYPAERLGVRNQLWGRYVLL